MKRTDQSMSSSMSVSSQKESKQNQNLLSVASVCDACQCINTFGLRMEFELWTLKWWNFPWLKFAHWTWNSQVECPVPETAFNLNFNQNAAAWASQRCLQQPSPLLNNAVINKQKKKSSAGSVSHLFDKHNSTAEISYLSLLVFVSAFWLSAFEEKIPDEIKPLAITAGRLSPTTPGKFCVLVGTLLKNLDSRIQTRSIWRAGGCWTRWDKVCCFVVAFEWAASFFLLLAFFFLLLAPCFFFLASRVWSHTLCLWSHPLCLFLTCAVFDCVSVPDQDLGELG